MNEMVHMAPSDSLPLSHNKYSVFLSIRGVWLWSRGGSFMTIFCQLPPKGNMGNVSLFPGMPQNWGLAIET